MALARMRPERVARDAWVKPPSEVGFTLLEVQVAAVLAVLAFSGLAMILTVQTNHLLWLEARGYTAGTTAPFGVMSVESDRVRTGTNLASVYSVDVEAVQYEGHTSVTATLFRRPANATDCGR